MKLEEAITRYTENAEYERQHGNLQWCLEFKQLAEWLKDYKRLLEQTPLEKVLEDIKGEIRNNNIADFIATQSAIDIIDRHISGKEEE